MTGRTAALSAASSWNDGDHGGSRARVEEYERKINKIKCNVGSWKTVRPGTKKSEPDSYLHRYARVVGSRLGDRDNEDEESSSDVSAALRRINALTADVKNRIKGQADFECYVLGLGARGQHTRYLTFLHSMKEPFDIEGNLKPGVVHDKIAFAPPTTALVQAWLLYLRETRGLGHGTVDGFLSGLSSTNGQYAGARIDRKKIGDLMDKWELEDIGSMRKKQAPAFDMVKDLPKLFIACFKIRRWTYIDSVIMWTAFLIMLAVIGRSSCMSVYCPLIEDIEFPTGPGGYNSDRLPKKVHTAWRNWKSRKNHVGEKYYITIQRNYTDSRFCPVFWLAYMLSLKKKRGDPMRGPLFPHRESKTFAARLKTLFKAAGLKECSSHSVRRTAAQWVVRCGYDIKTLVDVGRWLDLNEVRKYVGQGGTAHDEAVENATDGKDPISRVWYFRSAVRSTPGGEFHRA